MKVAPFVSRLCGVALAVALAAWTSGCGSEPTEAVEDGAGAGAKKPTGPQPVATTPEKTYNFGAMLLNEERSHDFVIRNDGDAPLELVNEGTSCSVCTRNDLEDTTLAPGEETVVPCVWFPDEHYEEFRKNFYVKTNDPLRPKIVLTVEGRVDNLLHIDPRSWDQGLVERGQDVEVEGKIFSRIADELAAPTFDHEDDVTIAEPIPLTAEELEELDATAGYRFRVTVSSDVVGSFTRQFSLLQTVEGEDEPAKFPLSFTGRITGPLSVQPLDGVEYYARNDGLDLGTFSAAEGKSFRVALVFKGVEEPLELEVDSPEQASVTVQKDVRYALPKREKHVVTIEFPPGTEPEARLNTGEFLEILVKTTHPDVPEVKFRLKYVAQ